MQVLFHHFSLLHASHCACLHSVVVLVSLLFVFTHAVGVNPYAAPTVVTDCWEATPLLSRTT